MRVKGFALVSGLVATGMLVRLFRLRAGYARAVYGQLGTGVWNWEAALIQSYVATDSEYDGSGKYALGEPNGLPALLQGYEGNYLALTFCSYFNRLLSQPINIGLLKLYITNLYNYAVGAYFKVQISLDGESWTDIWTPPGQYDIGSHTYEILVNQPILAVRVIITATGVNMGIDAIEALRPE